MTTHKTKKIPTRVESDLSFRQLSTYRSYPALCLWAQTLGPGCVVTFQPKPSGVFAGVLLADGSQRQAQYDPAGRRWIWLSEPGEQAAGGGR